jgi:putative ABC transport system permease protein
MQRDQIAVLKAFGYADRTIALHYLGFALVATALGAVAGTGLGLWLGAVVNRAYVQLYRFPVFRYAPGASVVALAVGVSAAAALLGALGGVRRALALPPAEAMRPEPPESFHAGWLERLALSRFFRSPERMILRNLARRPLRAGLSVLGIAFAVAIVVVGRYFVDAVDLLTDVQFRAVQREDLSVSFNEPLSARARHSVAALPASFVPSRTVSCPRGYGSSIARAGWHSSGSSPEASSDSWSGGLAPDPYRAAASC